MAKNITTDEIQAYNFCPMQYYYRFLDDNPGKLYTSLLLDTLKEQFKKMIEAKHKGAAAIKELKYSPDKLFNTLAAAAHKAKADGNVKLPTPQYQDKMLATIQQMGENFYKTIFTSNLKIVSDEFSAVVPGPSSGAPIEITVDFTTTSKNGKKASVVIDYSTSGDNLNTNRGFLYTLSLVYYFISGRAHDIKPLDSISLLVYRPISNELVTTDPDELLGLLESADQIASFLRTKNSVPLYHRLGFWCMNACPYYETCTMERK